MKASVARPLHRPNLLNAGRITDVMLQEHHTVRQSKSIVRPVTASKSRACREGHTSGPCRWLFLAARAVGDVKSLKALHRYNVVKAPAFAKATAWQANDEHARAGAARVGGNAARVAGTSPGEVRDKWIGCKLPER